MEWLISKFSRMSVKSHFIFYTSICILIAFCLSLISSSLCDYGVELIFSKYQKGFEKDLKEGEIVLNNGSKLEGMVYFYKKDLISFFSKMDKFFYDILNILKSFLIPFWFLISVIFASVIFYNKLLKPNFEILGIAADNISKNNLDFEIKCNNDNEFGDLCCSFEKMRYTLQENNYEMWRIMNNQRKINAAFSHDLRTPLTVLKGQNEMLLKYIPMNKISVEKTIDVLNTMKNHINRLEDYTKTMNKIQSIESIEIKKEKIYMKDLIKGMKETADILCKNFILNFTNNIEDEFIFGDFSMIMQVYENILSNSIRFSKSTINIILDNEDYFKLTISDDGEGFVKDDILSVSDPFYSSKKGKEGIHFGIGLYICKTLCEKHGGFLKIYNNDGAFVEAVF